LEEAFGKDMVEEYMRKINEDGLGEGEVVLMMMMKTMNGMVVRVNVNFNIRGVV